ncbi:uncharacterized protein LOC136024825 isoform X1 [Artemia franciscana]|uniref:uncharacterized protein LOC136024825 isoform X1 n=1 Tax=Artemia franciscana TaxID=6661 RepID=UPI0032DA1D42
MKAFALFKKVAIMYLPFYICLFVVCIFIYKSKGTIIKNISAQYDLKTVVEPCKITSYEQMRNIFFNSKKGLSDFDGVIKKQNQLWNMTRFSTLLGENNHTERIIDILKLDIEGSEYEAVPDMIYNNNLKNVKQIFLETHNNTALSLERYYSIYWLLSINNFVRFASEDWPHLGCARKNKEGIYEVYCYVFSFINMKYVVK